MEGQLSIKVFFKTISAKRGSIQVYYSGTDLAANEEPFLNEEKQFVETLALLISGFINVIYGLDKVIATEKGLEEDNVRKDRANQGVIVHKSNHFNTSV